MCGLLFAEGEELRGKPWTVEEENRLQQLLKAGKSVRVIAKILGKTRDCVHMKIARLGVEVVVEDKNVQSTTTTTAELVLPEELPSFEEALKILAASMNALKTPGLGKLEILRLRSLIQAAMAYQVKVAEFIDYCGIEARLAKMEEKYEHLLREEAKDLAPAKNNDAVSAG
jgi:hypothetical protein